MKENTGESQEISAQTQDVDTDETDAPQPEEELEERGGADGKAKALGKPGLGDFGRPNRSNQ